MQQDKATLFNMIYTNSYSTKHDRSMPKKQFLLNKTHNSTVHQDSAKLFNMISNTFTQQHMTGQKNNTI